MRSIFFILLASYCLAASGQNQDIIKFVHYNLLYFGATSNNCNGSNNSLDAKKQELAVIMSYLKPDILTVNELGPGNFLFNEILSGALNIEGEDRYQAANPKVNSNLGNMLFYNGNKMGLLKQEEIRKELLADGTFRGPNLVRLIDIYTLFYKDEEALQKGDTNKIHILVAHLKAGSTSANKEDRNEAAKAIMRYVGNKKVNRDNWIISGDFNIQSSTEDTYKTFTQNSTESIRFFDPVNSPGNWNNNNLFSNLHTQSTRTSNTNGGCFSGGGLDDRFDFILTGKEVINGDFGLKYISKSYRSVGNSGALFNQSIDASSNNSVPSEVKMALYNLSDHLPVQADFTIEKTTVGIEEANLAKIHIENPASSTLVFHYPQHFSHKTNISLYNHVGQQVKSFEIPAMVSFFETNISECPNGVYTIVLKTPKNCQTQKIIIRQQN